MHFEHWGLEGRRLDSEVETCAYRIVQESLTNVARHAAVEEVAVRAWATSSTLCLQIDDEGVGFDTFPTLLSREGMGLGSIRERAELLGGQVRIDSEPGTGTCLMVEIPLTPNEQPEGRVE